MTLTSPACPVAGSLPGEVQNKVLEQVEELTDSQVDITWDPPWSIDRMSEAAKLQLGMM
jgi:metal-sulfur cluster biosynthetic enzyme